MKGALASQSGRGGCRQVHGRGGGRAAGPEPRPFGRRLREQRGVGAAAAGAWLAAKANGKDDRNAPSPSIGWPSDCPDGDCPCFGSFEVCDPSSAAEEAVFAAAPGSESSMAANAKRSVAACGAARGVGATIAPETGAAAGAVNARLRPARDRRCDRARPALARSSAPARLLYPYPCRRRRGRRPKN